MPYYFYNKELLNSLRVIVVGYCLLDAKTSLQFFLKYYKKYDIKKQLFQMETTRKVRRDIVY